MRPGPSRDRCRGAAGAGAPSCSAWPRRLPWAWRVSSSCTRYGRIGSASGSPASGPAVGWWLRCWPGMRVGSGAWSERSGGSSREAASAGADVRFVVPSAPNVSKGGAKPGSTVGANVASRSKGGAGGTGVSGTMVGAGSRRGVVNAVGGGTSMVGGGTSMVGAAAAGARRAAPRAARSTGGTVKGSGEPGPEGPGTPMPSRRHCSTGGSSGGRHATRWAPRGTSVPLPAGSGA